MGYCHRTSTDPIVISQALTHQKAYSVFLAHYLSAGTLQGSTDLNYAFIGGLQFSMPFLTTPLSVKLLGKIGIKPTMLVGVFLITVSLLGASWATNIWHLYLSQGLGFGWGIGFFFVTGQNVVAQWFTKRRSLASGLAAMGTGCGSLLYSLVAGNMIENLGAGWALRVLAIVAGAVTILATLIIKDRNKEIQPKIMLFDLSLLAKPRFIMLTLFSSFNMLGEIIILTQVPSYGAATLGLSATQSSVIGAMVGLGQVLGRAGIGYLSDVLGRLNMAFLITFLAGLWTLAVWTSASSYGILIFYAVCIGAFA